MPKEIIVVDSQRLSTIQNCPYKYDLTFNHNFVPVNKQDFFERGDLIHKMLEQYYKLRKFQDNWRGKFSQGEIQKICEKVGEHFAVAMQLPVEEVDDVFCVFKEYVEYYWGEPHGTIAVEQVGSKIMFQNEELTILYETKIDWICSLSNVAILPVDHKSSRRRGMVNELSNQFMGYCWMLNVCNLMVNKIGFQTSVKPKDKFERAILSYPRPVIEEWLDNSVKWILELRRCYQRGDWKKNFTSCDKYNSGTESTMCVFRPVCLAPPEIRMAKANQLFNIRDENWDVGAKL